MRLGRYEVVLHSSNSITEEYCTSTEKFCINKTDKDLIIKIGRNLLIVSDINKICKHGGGVQET